MGNADSELLRAFASTTALLQEAAMLIALPSRQLVQVNQVFLDTLAFSPDQVIGRTPQEAGWWPNVDQMERCIADTAAGSVAEHVIAVQRRDGSSLRLPARAAVLQGAGLSRYLQVIIGGLLGIFLAQWFYRVW